MGDENGQVERRLVNIVDGHDSRAIRAKAIGTRAGAPNRWQVAVQCNGIHLRQVATAVKGCFSDSIDNQWTIRRKDLAVDGEGISAFNGLIGAPGGTSRGCRRAHQTKYKNRESDEKFHVNLQV